MKGRIHLLKPEQYQAKLEELRQEQDTMRVAEGK
jgi:hypothetical protein